MKISEGLSIKTLKSYPDLQIQRISRRQSGKFYTGLPRYINYAQPFFEMSLNFNNIYQKEFSADLEYMHRLQVNGFFYLYLDKETYPPTSDIAKYINLYQPVEEPKFFCTFSTKVELTPHYKNWSNPLSKAKFKFTGILSA